MLFAFVLGIIISTLVSDGLCNQKNVFTIDENNYLMVVLVLTAPKNIERRNAIRETWLNLRPKEFNGTDYQRDIIYIPPLNSNKFLQLEDVEIQKQLIKNYQKWQKTKILNVKVPNLKIKHLFAIGTESLSADLLNEVEAEQGVYSDLLLLDDLKDSYQNLTTKLIKSFQKLMKTTPNFKYILKSDDDTYAKLDLMAQDLINYEQKLKITKENHKTMNNLELYWGYFHGRAHIKRTGQWQETNFNLCDRYLPYALGGGYVLSKNLVKYIADHGDTFNNYVSEDISVGTWLAPFKNIHRRHDPRFDTAYMPRDCKSYHIVLHKRTAKDMVEISKDNLCYSEVKYDVTIKKPVEYFYDWKQSPLKCCDTRV